jgi:hypothetical protein
MAYPSVPEHRKTVPTSVAIPRDVLRRGKKLARLRRMSLSSILTQLLIQEFSKDAALTHTATRIGKLQGLILFLFCYHDTLTDVLTDILF